MLFAFDQRELATIRFQYLAGAAHQYASFLQRA